MASSIQTPATECTTAQAATTTTDYHHAELRFNSGYSHLRITLKYRLSPPTDFYQSADIIVETNPLAFVPGAALPLSETACSAFLCEKNEDGSLRAFTKTPVQASGLNFLRAASATPNTLVALKFILPMRAGYFIRADVIEERFRGCRSVQAASGFASSTEQRFEPCDDLDLQGLAGILSHACGAIMAHGNVCDDQGIDTVLLDLQNQLQARLSFPWLSQTPFAKKRVAIVQARKEFDTIDRFYMAARALNIELIAVDSPGHWLEDSDGPSSILRHAFVPFDMTVDESFPERLYDALLDFKLDAIMSNNDRHLAGVARAAELLGLPTMPSQALRITTDKFATRAAEESALADRSAASFCVENVDHLDALLQEKSLAPLHYPLIVKPCLGWSSDCVARVTNETELREAVLRASTRHIGSLSTNTRVAVEPYINGPEVDTNMVLLDGECLFFEISDDFPSTGDTADGSAQQGNFQETQILYPTALPEEEQVILRDGIQASLLRLGLRTGIYHVEARVRDSRMEYQSRGHRTIDLVPRSKTTTTSIQPTCWLLEINARPPGGMSDWATSYIHGVCYHGLAILAALDDKERLRHLSIPFMQSSEPLEVEDAQCCPTPQFHCMLTYMSAEASGVLVNSPCDDTQARSPDLTKHVLRKRCWYKPGELVSGPQDASLGWLATYLVFSEDGDNARNAILDIGNQVRKEFYAEII